MTAHKHAEMIKAKADNMELVVFIKHNNESEWKLMKYCNFPEFGGTHQYFLCHPKHTQECLHWLNGGEVMLHNLAYWEQYPEHQGYPYWDPKCVFMNDEFSFRIKPRKEKRWIAVNAETGQTTSTFTTKMMAVNMVPDEDGLWQFIEIEVEV